MQADKRLTCLAVWLELCTECVHFLGQPLTDPAQVVRRQPSEIFELEHEGSVLRSTATGAKSFPLGKILWMVREGGGVQFPAQVEERRRRGPVPLLRCPG